MANAINIQHAVLLNVTDLELTASQTVKLIFLTILLLGALFNVYRFFKAPSTARKIKNAAVAVILIGIAIPVKRWHTIEGSLLHDGIYVTGTTLRYCEEFAKGVAIEYEYEVDGVKYSNCYAYHPVPKDQIKVPGGKYKVRVSRKYPDKGRMVFREEVKE